MATDARKTTKNQRRDPWRSIYRLTADQVFQMVEHGILPEDGHIELWDGVLYKMTKGELHNAITTAVADVLRRVTPAGYCVREEKSCSYGENSLPEPDVAVCRGDRWSHLPKPPGLDQLALVVEVDHTTKPAEITKRHRRFAEVGIPVFWQIGAEDRRVVVWEQPSGRGVQARYNIERAYRPGEDFPIVIDGREVGRAAVADFFPPETAR